MNLRRATSCLVALFAVSCGRAHEAPAPAPESAPAEPVSWVLPGEYEPVDRLLVAWDDGFEALQADLIDVALRYAGVTVVVDASIGSESVRRRLRARGVSSPHLAVIEEELELPWIRDFGPLVVRSSAGQRRIVDPSYFQAGVEDDLPARLADDLGVSEVAAMPLVIEGGNVLSDGRGLCVTTAAYDEPDEPSTHMDAEDVRDQLGRHLGCRQVVIVPPLLGERTGHVDMFVTITGPGEAMVGHYEVDQDPLNSVRTDEAARLLEVAGFAVRRVPMPDNGDDVFRSYTNAIAINGAVLVPVYDTDRHREAEAFEVFRAAYPDRDLVAIESSEAIELDGALHCLTMTVAQ